MLKAAFTCGFITIAAFLTGASFGQDAPGACSSFPFEAPVRAPIDAGFDIIHADLSADLAEDGSFDGRVALEVELTAEADVLTLTQRGVIVDSVRLGAVSLDLDVTSEDSLLLTLPGAVPAETGMRLVVHFSGRLESPAPAVYHVIDRFGTWFPSSTNPHDRFTVELTLTVPVDWSVAASGIPTGQQTAEDGRPTHRFMSPHPLTARNIAFAAGMVESETRFASLPDGRRPALTWWMPRDRRSDRPRAPDGTIPVLREKLAFASRWTGFGFPFERYTQLHVDADAVASSGLVVVPPYVEPDDRTATPYRPPSALTRPLIKQWFGGIVSPSAWEDVWLEEAFPTYVDLLSIDSGTPDESALRSLREEYVRSGATPRPLVWNRWNHPSELVDVQTTARGAWVLHMLRRSVGDAAFRRAMERFVSEHPFENASTADWLSVVEAEADRDLSTFADAWIYGAGHPILNVGYDPTDDGLRVSIEQVQTGDGVANVFPLDIQVEVGALGEAERFDVRIDERATSFVLPFSGQPRFVAIDPAGEWLLQSRVDQAASASVAQLRYASTPHARLEAAASLGDSTEDPALILGLRSALDAEPDPSVRAAIIQAIGRLPRTGAAERALIAGFEDASPDVRKAVLRALADSAATPAAAQLALRAAESDADYHVQAEAVRTLAAIGTPNAVDVARAALVTPSHDEVIRAAGLDALSVLVDRARAVALEEGRRYASADHPRRLRLAAARLLGRLTAEGPAAVDRLVDLTVDPDPAVAWSAASALYASGHRAKVLDRLDDISDTGVRARVRDLTRACP